MAHQLADLLVIGRTTVMADSISFATQKEDIATSR